MGKLRCDLDKTERDLDMQSWVVKNKPFQSTSIVSVRNETQLIRQDLDELAHDLTLDTL